MLRMAQITYNPPDTRPQFNSTPNAFPEMYASETNLTIANEGASSIKARRFPTIQASEGVKNMSVASNPRMSIITANGSDAEMQANANYLNGTHTVSHHGPKNNVAHGHGMAHVRVHSTAFNMILFHSAIRSAMNRLLAAFIRLLMLGFNVMVTMILLS
mmetsp:Transcript_30797/g.48285  ORF Transcript_30797/g.48285 Transcript_30797/m.48285 type:complete len:159 (+) Transcript_30797:595-1071(+)